jgi:hypothetical protein
MSGRPSENNVVGQGRRPKTAPPHRSFCAALALSRPVTVDGVGEEYGGADNAEKRGDGFQHDNDP